MKETTGQEWVNDWGKQNLRFKGMKRKKISNYNDFIMKTII
jgi:hypothetical protein